VVRQYARKAGIEKLAGTISGELAPGSAIRLVAN